MRVIRCIAAAAFLFASSAHAALVSVTADTGWFAQSFEGVVIPEFGTMNLVYDTSVTDSDPSPTVGRYDGAIVSFVMTVEQQNRPDLFFTLAPAPTTITVLVGPGDGAVVEFLLTATEQSGAYGIASDMTFRGRVLWFRDIYPGDSLPRVADWNTGYGGWPGPVAHVASLGPALEHDWAWNFRAVELPLTGTWPLMVGGALPLLAFGLKNRRAARRSNRQQ